MEEEREGSNKEGNGEEMKKMEVRTGAFGPNRSLPNLASIKTFAELRVGAWGFPTAPL